MPLAVIGDISDPKSGSKLYKIVEMTIDRLEGRYGDRIQFDHKWQIELLEPDKIQTRWCKVKSVNNYEKCMNDMQVEAFYEVSTGTIILRNDLQMEQPFDVGSIIHEVTHYMQDRHGLTGRGWYSKCMPWLEYDATLIEQELITKTGLHIPSWYTNHLNKWTSHWKNELNLEKTDCK